MNEGTKIKLDPEILELLRQMHDKLAVIQEKCKELRLDLEASMNK